MVYPCHHLCGLQYPDYHHICRDPIGLPTTGGIPYFITGAVPLSGGSRNFRGGFQVRQQESVNTTGSMNNILTDKFMVSL